MRVSNYIIGAPLSDQRFYILLHGLTGAVDKIVASLGRDLVERRGLDIDRDHEVVRAISDETLSHLQHRGYLTDLGRNEERALMVEVAATLHEADLATSPASFVFVPAYTCNLRCPYCFQSHHMHAGRGEFSRILSPERVDQAFRIIDQFARPGAIAAALQQTPERSDPSDTFTFGGSEASFENNESASHENVADGKSIGLFGGEPLSAATVSVVSYIVEQAQCRNRSVWAISNGVELDRFEDVLGPGLIDDIQITLDGLAELHDRRRIGPGFHHTFDRIVDNIDMALARGVSIKIRMNIDTTNVDHVQRLSDFFDQRGWSRLPTFYAGAAVVTGEAMHKPLMSRADLVQITARMRATRGSQLRSYENYAADTLRSCLFSGSYPFQRVAHCSAETGLLMFDPLGDVYSCWEEIGEHDRRIAIYDERGITFDQEMAGRWLARFPGAIEQCSFCPYALVHKAGCAKHAREASGTIFAAACESFQQFFPVTLAQAYEELEARMLTAPSTDGVKLSAARLGQTKRGGNDGRRVEQSSSAQ